MQVTDADRKARQHIETLQYISGQYLPGGPRDIKGAIRAACSALDAARHRNQSTAALMGEVERWKGLAIRAVHFIDPRAVKWHADYAAALSTPSEVREPNPDEVAGAYSAFEVREPEAIGGEEAVAWLYEKNGKRSLQLSRQPWNTAPGRDWIETPLYAAPQPVSDSEEADLRDFASLMVDEVIAKLRLQLEAEEGLSLQDQKHLLGQLVAERRKLQGATPLVSGDAVQEALDWFSGQRRLSLQHYSPMYGDDDDQSVEWRVHRESGSINDREWEIVGRGETALAAILAALNHGGTQS